MAHVAYGRSDCVVLVFDEIVDLFIGWIASGDEVVLVEVGVVRSGCIDSYSTETAETTLGNSKQSLQIASDCSHHIYIFNTYQR